MAGLTWLRRMKHLAVRRRLLVYVMLPLAYVITGRLGLLLAVPPGYATAVFVPAGIAVGAVFMAGPSILPGIFIGSLLLNLWVGYSIAGHFELLGSAAALVIAVASALQAALGGAVLRRVIGYPAGLDNPRDLVSLLVLSPVFCLTSASLFIGLDMGARRGSVRRSAVKLDHMVGRRHARRACDAAAAVRAIRGAPTFMAIAGLVGRRSYAPLFRPIRRNFHSCQQLGERSVSF